MWSDNVYDFFKQLKIKYPRRRFYIMKMGLYAPRIYYLKAILSGEGYLTFVFDATTSEIRKECVE